MVGTLGKGTLVQIGNSTGGASTTWTSINYIRESITWGGRTRAMVDATHHQTSGSVEEMLPALMPAGTISFTAIYDPADSTYQLLNTLHETSAPRDFKVVFPNTALSEKKCVAYVTEVGETYPLKDIVVYNVTITGTGAVTNTPAPS